MLLRLIPLLIILTISCSIENTENSIYPNILFIVADDLGYHDLSCMGSSFYETPNIDRIAADGTLFTNGYATCQVCSPSRASLLSGRIPARHGITDWIGAKTGQEWSKLGRHNKLLPPEYQMHLPHEYVILPEALKENGYSTFFAGKWHLGREGSYPTDHGFDVNQGGFEAGGPYTGGFFSPFNNPQMEDYPEEEGISLPMKLARETGRFIAKSEDQPFLAYLSFYAVHAPIQTTQRNWAKYQAKAEGNGLVDTGFVMERRLPIRAVQDNPVYAGLIEHMDDAVGHVLHVLDSMGLSDNTIVVFTSDNGGVASGDNYSTANLPLRGGKGYQWEGGLRVPLLIKVPWMTDLVSVSDVPVTGADLYPTLLDIAGIALRPTEHIDGKSFKPSLQGDNMNERALIWHYPHYGNQGGDPSSVIRKGKWKLIHYHETDHYELYNLTTDKEEQNDISEQHKVVAKTLYQELLANLNEMDAKFPTLDSSYNQTAALERYSRISNELKSRLEGERKDMLQPNWQPNDDWWGSIITED